MRCMRPVGIGLMGAMLAAFAGCGKDDSLTCYVGGTMRPVMQKLADIYEKRTGQKIALDYRDSGSLLIAIEKTGKGDLYVCHDPFMDVLDSKKLGVDGYVIASLTPMIGVPKGNPKGVKGLEDLARDDLKWGLTDEKYSTLGNILPYMLRKLPAEVQAKIEARMKAGEIPRTRSGGDTANKVGLGKLDACIVWNAVLFARSDKLDRVDIEAKYRPDPSVDTVTSASPGYSQMGLSVVRVTISTLKCSKRYEDAKKFADFVNSDEARKIFAEFGFSPAPAATTAPATQGDAGTRPEGRG